MTKSFSVDLPPVDLTCAIIHERFFALNVSILSINLAHYKKFHELYQTFSAISSTLLRGINVSVHQRGLHEDDSFSSILCGRVRVHRLVWRDVYALVGKTIYRHPISKAMHLRSKLITGLYFSPIPRFPKKEA